MTKHSDSCTMAFGRPSKHATCPRCEELKGGATARKGYGWRNKEQEARTLRAIRSHDFAACQKQNGCCTHFEW